MDSYGIVNAQIDLDIEDLGGNFGGLNVAVFATNLFDNEHFVGGFGLSLFGGAALIANQIVGDPQQFGIRVTKDF